MENKEELELLKMLDEAEEDVRNGRVWICFRISRY